jgi:tripartite-type tricarboxylate transporter receptor subunit TctC
MFKTLVQGCRLALFIGLSLIFLCTQVQSADFPKNPVKIIVTSAAGGGEDTEARGIAPYVEKHLGVKVTVEVQAGAGGKIAMEKFMKTEPDGYSLISYTFPKSIIIEYMGKTSFRTKDFTPIFGWSRTNQLLVVHADTWKTFEEFLKGAKEKVLAGGLSGRGSTTHFAGLVAMDELDLKVKWVPYDGAAESLAALAGKHLDFTICTAPSAVSLIRAGKLRPLIMFADKRDPYFPDVPVPQELGFKVSSLPAVRGVEGPPNTPASIVKVLEEAFGKAVKEPGYLDWAQKVRVVIHPLSAQEYAKLVADTYPQVEKVQQLLKE